MEPRCVDVRRVLQHGRRRHRRRRRRRLRLRRHRPDPDGAVTRGGKQEAVSVPVQVINGAFVAFQGHFKNPCCCNEQQFWLLILSTYWVAVVIASKVDSSLCQFFINENLL